jgi:hypothetical protein
MLPAGGWLLKSIFWSSNMRAAQASWNSCPSRDARAESIRSESFGTGWNLTGNPMPLRVRNYTEVHFHTSAGYVCSRYCASFEARRFCWGGFATWASARLTRFNPGFHIVGFPPRQKFDRSGFDAIIWGARRQARVREGGDGKRRRSDSVNRVGTDN